MKIPSRAVRAAPRLVGILLSKRVSKHGWTLGVARLVQNQRAEISQEKDTRQPHILITRELLGDFLPHGNVARFELEREPKLVEAFEQGRSALEDTSLR